MGKITVKINYQLDRAMRVHMAQQGMKKGDLTRVIEKGIELWIEQQKQEG